MFMKWRRDVLFADFPRDSRCINNIKKEWDLFHSYFIVLKWLNLQQEKFKLLEENKRPLAPEYESNK